MNKEQGMLNFEIDDYIVFSVDESDFSRLHYFGNAGVFWTVPELVEGESRITAKNIFSVVAGAGAPRRQRKMIGSLYFLPFENSGTT